VNISVSLTDQAALEVFNGVERGLLVSSCLTSTALQPILCNLNFQKLWSTLCAPALADGSVWYKQHATSDCVVLPLHTSTQMVQTCMGVHPPCFAFACECSRVRATEDRDCEGPLRVACCGRPKSCFWRRPRAFSSFSKPCGALQSTPVDGDFGRSERGTHLLV